MERDQAVDIAGKFAGHFPSLVGEAHSNGGNWELHIRTPNQWLAVATTRDQAAKLWHDLELMGVLHK